MERTKKNEVVASLKEKIQDKIVILLHYKGLSAAEIYNIRVSLKQAGANMQVVKNTLARLVFDDIDEVFKSYLKGPTAIAYADDPVTLAKILVEFAKENEMFEIQVGNYEAGLLQKGEIVKLSKLGSLNDMRASLLSILTAGPAKFVRLIKAPASNVVAACNNYASK